MRLDKLTTPEMLNDLIDACDAYKPVRDRSKGADPIYVHAYVAFHRAHYRKRARRQRDKIIPINRHAG